MAKLSNHLDVITQRTSRSLDLTSGEGRNRFLTSLTGDLASILGQINTVYYPLFSTLAQLETADALEKGLSGNVIYTDIDATPGSGSVFYDSATGRARTLKESFDVILTQLGNLQGTVSGDTTVEREDTATALEVDISTNRKNLNQLRKDTQGVNYAFDNDGNANLSFPLAQHLDAIGAFFTNYPTTGNTYGGVYPTLSLAINLSDINIDTTLPQSAITNLSTHLTNIRNFIGMGTVSETPTYSAHGTVEIVTDGDSLEEAIQKLDEQVTVHLHQDKRFVFAPSGVAGGEVYTSWASLYTDLSAVTGDHTATVYFDDSANPGVAFTIPAGSYDMSNVRWAGSPHQTQDSTFTLPTDGLPTKRVTFETGVTITDLYEIEGLQLYIPAAVTTPLSYTSSSLRVINLKNVVLTAAATSNALIAVTGTGTHFFKCDDQCEIGDGTNDVIAVSAGGTISFSLTNRSYLNANSISGAGDVGAITRDITSTASQTQGGLSGSILGYVVDGAAFTGATGVADGLKGLVPAPAAGEDTYILRGDGTWVNFPGGAPASATYVCISTDGTLTNERTLAVDAGELTLTDNGAGNTVSLGLANTAVTPGAYTLADITVDAFGRITAAANGSAATSPFSTTTNVTSNAPGDMTADDFVFGSDSLADDGDATHDSRFLFDKSSSAFRAGIVTGTQWNTRGTASAAFGSQTTAASHYSFVTGSVNSVSGGGNYASILGGISNTISASTGGTIIGGTTNTLSNNTGGFIAGVNTGTINAGGAGAAYAAIVGGATNTIGASAIATNSFIGGGTGSAINGINSFIGGGNGGSIATSYSGIVGGDSNVITAGSHSFIGGGEANTINAGGDYNFIIGGTNLDVLASGGESFLVGGNTNTINGDIGCAVIGGTLNDVDGGSYNFIIGGQGNTIDTDGDYNIVLAGDTALVNQTGVAYTVSMGKGVTPFNSYSWNRSAGDFPAAGTPGAGIGDGHTLVSEYVLMGVVDDGGSTLNLTTDGNQTVSAANVLYLPENSAAHIKIEYVLNVSHSSTPIFVATNYYGGAQRLTGATAGLLLQNRSVSGGTARSSVEGSVGSSVLASSSNEDLTFVASGTSGGFYFACDLAAIFGSGLAGSVVRMVANVTLTQLRFDPTETG